MKKIFSGLRKSDVKKFPSRNKTENGQTHSLTFCLKCSVHSTPSTTAPRLHNRFICIPGSYLANAVASG